MLVDGTLWSLRVSWIDVCGCYGEGLGRDFSRVSCDWEAYLYGGVVVLTGEMSVGVGF